jgi:hypothetical protein
MNTTTETTSTTQATAIAGPCLVVVRSLIRGAPLITGKVDAALAGN